jgi:hypothetical protein
MSRPFLPFVASAKSAEQSTKAGVPIPPATAGIAIEDKQVDAITEQELPSRRVDEPRDSSPRPIIDKNSHVAHFTDHERLHFAQERACGNDDQIEALRELVNRLPRTLPTLITVQAGVVVRNKSKPATGVC